MDKWLFLIVIVCFLFCLTYDPKSHNLDKYIIGENTREKYENAPAQMNTINGCCDDVNYMSNNYRQCGPAHFQGVQFAESYNCPRQVPVTDKGAILHN